MPSEKILIVDDERLVRWSLRQKCEEWGYHVAEAEAGEPGLKVAHDESPDLVLLDVVLPDQSGLVVAQELARAPDPPRVVLTSSRGRSDFGAGFEWPGGCDFVPKHELSGPMLKRLLGS